MLQETSPIVTADVSLHAPSASLQESVPMLPVARKQHPTPALHDLVPMVAVLSLQAQEEPSRLLQEASATTEEEAKHASNPLHELSATLKPCRVAVHAESPRQQSVQPKSALAPGMKD